MEICTFPVNIFEMHRNFSEDEEEAFVAEFDSITTESTGEFYFESTGYSDGLCHLSIDLQKLVDNRCNMDWDTIVFRDLSGEGFTTDVESMSVSNIDSPRVSKDLRQGNRKLVRCKETSNHNYMKNIERIAAHVRSRVRTLLLDLPR